MHLFNCVNLLIDLIPNIIGMTAACICANNKIEKNKIKSQNKFILNLNAKLILSYLSREIYHWPITIIITVSTKGKAGYFV